jgi:hypothetical protein
MSAFEEIVAEIDPDYYDMKWAIFVSLDPEDPTVDDTVYTVDLQFMEYYTYRKGAKFYKQTGDDDPVQIPESQAPVQRFVDFFKNDRLQNQEFFNKKETEDLKE